MVIENCSDVSLCLDVKIFRKEAVYHTSQYHDFENMIVETCFDHSQKIILNVTGTSFIFL